MSDNFYMGFVYKDGEGNFQIEGEFSNEILKVVDGEIILPDSAKYLTIGDSAFEDTPIRRFDFSKVESISEWGFYNSQIEEAILTELFACRYAAFAECKNLKKVVIAAREIEERAFENCTNLEEIELLDGVEKIGGCAFSGTKIKSLKLPESVRKFELSAILSTPLENLEISEKANMTVTFPSNYRRECFPKLSRKNYLQLLKFYPQAYYELIPSEYFGSKSSFDKNYDTLCQSAIFAGLKMRGTSPSEMEEILAKVAQRTNTEKKSRSSSNYQRTQQKRIQHAGKYGK